MELKFVKNGFAGVEIECMRGTDIAFNFLARDTEAPYVDTRANLTDGLETRHYRARYLQKDNPAADYSDVLVVTVPGVSATHDTNRARPAWVRGNIGRAGGNTRAAFVGWQCE